MVLSFPPLDQKWTKTDFEVYGGGGGIRTLDNLAAILVFETSLIDHSSTPPLDFLRLA